MWPLLRSARYLPHFRHITAVLSRHGLGWLADQVGLTRLLRWPGRLFRRPSPAEPPPSLAQRLCLALEELGPTFVLLGRYLSTRVDLFPPEICAQLSCLPPHGELLSRSEVAQIVEEELGRPLQQSFAHLAAEPWRVTWLEQVYAARTPQGEPALVSVPHRRVHRQVAEDRPMLRDLARLVGRRREPELRQAIATGIAAFDEVLRQYLDARERGRNAERWGQISFRGVVLPTVDWERTTADLLTLRGTPGRPLRDLASEPEQQAALLQTLLRFLGRTIFAEGFYPAPPDLGAPIVLPDGQLSFAALAPIGYMGSSVRQAILRLLERFRDEEVEGLVTAGVAVGLFERRQISTATHQGVRHLIERYYGLPLAEVSLQGVAQELHSMDRRQLIDLSEELSLLLRTLAALESWCGDLAPQISVLEMMAPEIRRAMAALHAWSARRERIVRAAYTWVEALQHFPGTFRQVLAQAKEGNLMVGLEPRNWRAPMRRLGRMVHRLVMSALIAGLLISLALISTALLPGPWPAWGWIIAGLSLSTLAILGFLLLLSFLQREE